MSDVVGWFCKKLGEGRLEYEAFGRGKLGGKRVKGDGFVAGVFVGENV